MESNRLKLGEVVFIVNSETIKQPESLISGKVKECIYYTGTEEPDLYIVSGEDNIEYTAYYPNPNNLENGLLTRDEYLEALKVAKDSYNKEKGYFDKLIAKEKKNYEKRVKQIEKDSEGIVLKIEKIQKAKEETCKKYGHIISKLQTECYLTSEFYWPADYSLGQGRQEKFTSHEREFYVCPYCGKKVITKDR